ncbi:hypothetical protein Vafri_700 [Volvox africanus]|nr:hypothetical protein Vafri_700 [Volvox africanus]
MEALLQISKFYEELALSCFGPYGRLKALQAATHTPASVITSVSGPLVQGIRATHPFGQLLVAGTAQAQHAQYGDGGLACLYLAARIVQAVVENSPCRGDLYESIRVLQALGHMVQGLLSSDMGNAPNPVSTTLQIVACKSVQQYLALCRGVLLPKLGFFLSTHDVEHLAALTVETFVATLPDEDPDLQSAASLPCVSFQTFRGEDVRESCVLPGVVIPVSDIAGESFDILVDLAVRQGNPDVMPHGTVNFTIGDIGILLVREGLDVRGSQHNDSASTGLNGLIAVEQPAWERPGGAEAQDIQRLLTMLDGLLQQSPNTHIVGSQKGINPVVQDWLVRRGIAPLQRLGAMHITAMGKTAGCTPVDSLLHCEGSRACGRLHAEIKAIGGHQVLHLRPTTHASVVTIALCCPMDSLSGHLKHTAESSIHLLRTTLQQRATAVEGAGRIENALAMHIENWAARLSRASVRQEAVICSVALALRQLKQAVTLSSSCSTQAQGALGDFDPYENENGNMRFSYLDSLPCKLSCIQRAVSTAIQLIKLAHR